MNIVVMKRNAKKNNYSVVASAGYSKEADNELEIELDKGEYLIVPLTTGAYLRKSSDAPPEPIPYLITKDAKSLHPAVELQVKDLFLRLDQATLVNKLGANEFQAFFKRVNIPFTQQYFE